MTRINIKSGAEANSAPRIIITTLIVCIKNYNDILIDKVFCICNLFTDFFLFRTIRMGKFMAVKGGESGAVGY